jgi:hypothetical protein
MPCRPCDESWRVKTCCVSQAIPDTATAEDIRRFQLHLSETGVSICNRIITGLRFLLRVPLRRLDLAEYQDERWHPLYRPAAKNAGAILPPLVCACAESPSGGNDAPPAEWVTGKGAFVRASLSQAHFGGAGSVEPRRYRRRRGQANRLTGADRGRSSPCARDISPICGWSVNLVP